MRGRTRRRVGERIRITVGDGKLGINVIEKNVTKGKKDTYKSKKRVRDMRVPRGKNA